MLSDYYNWIYPLKWNAENVLEKENGQTNKHTQLSRGLMFLPKWRVRLFQVLKGTYSFTPHPQCSDTVTDLKRIIKHWPRFRVSARSQEAYYVQFLDGYANGEHSAPPLSLSHSFAISHKSECRPLSVCSCTDALWVWKQMNTTDMWDY